MNRRAAGHARVRDGTSVRSLAIAIRGLPTDRPIRNPRKWYLTQQEHWLGWLSEYHGPGAYRRQTGVKRDARYAYNHIVEPAMLLYLAKAARVNRKLLAAARCASAKKLALAQKSSAVRAVIPWEIVAAALWPKLANRVKQGLPRSENHFGRL